MINNRQKMLIRLSFEAIKPIADEAPHDLNALYMLGVACLATGRIEQGELFLTEVHHARPDFRDGELLSSRLDAPRAEFDVLVEQVVSRSDVAPQNGRRRRALVLILLVSFMSLTNAQPEMQTQHSLLWSGWQKTAQATCGRRWL